MMDTGNFSDLTNTVCFLVTVDYYGVPFRFSTFPVTLENGANEIRFDGGLFSDPNISQRTKIVGFDVESDTVSMEVIFDFDLVADFMRGRRLDDSACEVAMVTLNNDTVIQTFDDRIVLFSGRIIQPIIGNPERPSGHVAFSIENKQNVKKNSIISEEARINSEIWPFQHFESAEGKLAPVVFGRPYNYPRPSGTGISVGVAECSPAYEVRRKFSGHPAGPYYNEVWIQIASHEIEASSVFIHDFQNNSASFTVATENDPFGNVCSLVNINGSSLVHSKILGINTDDIHYWCRWGDYSGSSTGGAHPNPFGSGVLEGGGDLCRWALERTELMIDWSAWNGIAEFLNRYKFAGYINESVPALEWLQDNIIEHLPIDVVNGAYGLRPILSLYHSCVHFRPTSHVVDSGEFEIVSSLIPLTEPSDIVNRPIVRFAWSGKSDDFKTSMMIDPEKTHNSDFRSFRDPISDMSYSRYGIHEKTYDLNYVYDLHTASKILRDKVRIFGLGVTSFEVSAVPKYGFLRVGDVVSIDSHRLSMTNHVGQIISKSWRGGRWSFIIHIEDNIHANQRN